MMNDDIALLRFYL